jgi:endogenous inhibitor of DNA gyrase (YacG/DUF329 family)
MSEPPPERKCAICGKPQEARFRPFCSRRCADVDLGRWLKGGYFIPGKDTDETEGPSFSGRSDTEKD